MEVAAQVKARATIRKDRETRWPMSWPTVLSKMITICLDLVFYYRVGFRVLVVAVDGRVDEGGGGDLANHEQAIQA